ncbi:tRNA pseudouridine55 synthase [Breznakibacter xylanolyticus]|uniref:tRNA pseudouridine synthase B n=1 Tax=Breznakibacter xylanolyticus TaxID=990 RepID=A0A2W7NGF9_9BACT|nr:tRNA pseudouridine(55) synthase TruB [Breznakibacter xylanolyticus]MBN2743195.1 tRNA pseudouridine(55) synthase TruB [Marinilabiliaceae bacterium]PZX19501.1 tRNA pseudouridine55 synthase [Breznakibacter xylanolyticus]
MIDYLEGEMLLFDKPYEWTSFDLVNKIRVKLKHTLRKKNIKVGHAGTLDPLATGLMIVCTGKATKRIDQLSGLDKEYVATIELGATTPTYDLESNVDNRFPTEHITREVIEAVLCQFKGDIEQMPPIYSAIKIKGEKAYDLARRGDKVELKPRPITIHALEILDFEMPRLVVRVHCSKGTYIRSLAHDIGQALSSGAHLTGLIRTRIGEFSLDGAQKIENFVRNLQLAETNE